MGVHAETYPWPYPLNEWIEPSSFPIWPYYNYIQKVCQKCGVLIDQFDKFCRFCGTEQKQEKFCPACGKKIES